MRHMQSLLGLLVVLALVAPLAAPQSVAYAQSDERWRGEYYDNPNLAGTPRVVREDYPLNFKWGAGAPAPGLPSDHFSVRWTRTILFPPGDYELITVTDDGVRLFVDGRLVIDQWHPMSATKYTTRLYLSRGQHTLRMEYFEHTGDALARIWWQRVDDSDVPPGSVPPGSVPPDTPVGPPAPPLIVEWRGEYYANASLAGSAALLRNDKNLNFDWGSGAPAPGFPADNFSVRWTRTLNFEGGTYRFITETDDGVRLYVDNQLLIDAWREMSRTRIERRLKLSAGQHTLRMEYFERSGLASAKLSWQGPEAVPRVGNLITCVPPWPAYAWIKVYQRDGAGGWLDMNPRGWSSINPTGYLKIDGLPVDYYRYGREGHPYRVELWVNGALRRSVGNTDRGEASFRLRPNTDNYTPWGCAGY